MFDFSISDFLKPKSRFDHDCLKRNSIAVSAEDTRIKKIRAPNFFIFSTNTEKTLFGAEPPGGLLNMKKNLTTRAFTNTDLAEFSTES